MIYLLSNEAFRMEHAMMKNIAVMVALHLLFANYSHLVTIMYYVVYCILLLLVYVLLLLIIMWRGPLSIDRICFQSNC